MGNKSVEKVKRKANFRSIAVVLVLTVIIASAAVLAENLSDVVAASSRKTVLALADRNISAGDLMKFAALARKSGVTKVLFAEKKAETDE